MRTIKKIVKRFVALDTPVRLVTIPWAYYGLRWKKHLGAHPPDHLVGIFTLRK